jgi:tetratricopeptide (TPR) repeat protein
MNNIVFELKQAEDERTAGKLGSAKKRVVNILRFYPNYFSALMLLGLIYADEKETEKAYQALLNAFLINPENDNLKLSIAALSLDTRKYQVAKYFLSSIKEHGAEYFNIYAKIYIALKQYEDAKNAFENSLRYDANWYDTRFYYAKCLADLGLTEQASKCLVELYTGGFATIEVIDALTGPDVNDCENIDIEKHIHHLSNKNLEDGEHYVLANLHHRKGNYDFAWAMWAKAKELKLSKEINQLKQLEQDNKIFLEANKKYSIPAKPLRSFNKPVFFISGPSRSGKTTLENILSRSLKLKAGYESTLFDDIFKNVVEDSGLPYQKNFHFSILTNQMIDFFKIGIDQNLENFCSSSNGFSIATPGVIYGVLSYMHNFDNVYFVHVYRNLDDHIFKIFTRNYKEGNEYALSIDSIKNYINWYGQMADIILSVYPQRSLRINYEDMIDNPSGIVEKISKMSSIECQANSSFSLKGDVGISEEYKKHFC